MQKPRRRTMPRYKGQECWYTGKVVVERSVAFLIIGHAIDQTQRRRRGRFWLSGNFLAVRLGSDGRPYGGMVIVYVTAEKLAVATQYDTKKGVF